MTVLLRPGESVAFEDDAQGVLRAVRDSFAQILEALPGNISRPHQLAKALRIDKKLAWKVQSVVDKHDLFVAAHHVPGPTGIQIFLHAAQKAGVPAARIAAATAATSEFQRLIDVHAGDRATLEMMLTSRGRRGRETVDVMHRKAAFRANSYIWGVQARTQLKAVFLHPGSERSVFDLASLRGFIALRRIRANVPWLIGRGRCVDNDGQPRTSFSREPLDPDVNGATDVPLLRDFCSRPLPKVRRTRGVHGFLDDEIVEGPVGKTADITCITGEVYRNCGSRYRDEHNRYNELISLMRTPCEVLIFDHIVHDDLFGQLEPELLIWSDLTEAVPYPEGGREVQTLPVCENVTYLGKGPSFLHTPDVPRYPEMARYILARLGWDGERFSVYRSRVVFPAIPTSVVMRYELPESPAV